MPFIIVRKNNIGIYGSEESIDDRLYMTEIEAIYALDEKQQEYSVKLGIAQTA